MAKQAPMITTEGASESFGERMARLRRERGETGSPNPAGRKPIAEKFRKQIDAANRTFADSLPDLAAAFRAEVYSAAPETCPTHQGILRCSWDDCDYESRRTNFDYRAAAYVFDRIMGKPTTRSENSLTINLVEQVVSVVLIAFGEVNALPDPVARQQTFARRCLELSAGLTGTAA